MILTFLAAALASHPAAGDVAYDELVAGQNDAAIVVIGEAAIRTDDPARLINLGIAHARIGDRQKARALFARAYYSREWVELQTATGTWVDSRILARQALAMLNGGAFGSVATLARSATP